MFIVCKMLHNVTIFLRYPKNVISQPRQPPDGKESHAWCSAGLLYEVEF